MENNYRSHVVKYLVLLTLILLTWGSANANSDSTTTDSVVLFYLDNSTQLNDSANKILENLQSLNRYLVSYSFIVLQHYKADSASSPKKMFRKSKNLAIKKTGKAKKQLRKTFNGRKWASKKIVVTMNNQPSSLIIIYTYSTPKGFHGIP